MRGVNKVILLGNVGNDPDVRYTTSGNCVANFSLATSDSYKDKSGQTVEQTEWHRVVIWGKLAEIAQQYVSKGSKLYIEGKNKTKNWTDNNGVEKYTTEIVIDFNGTMVMLDGKERQQDGTGEAANQSNSHSTTPDNKTTQNHMKNTTNQNDDFDDDIPF